MIRVLLVAILCAAHAAQAAETAYTALRVIGKREGQTVLNRVLEVRGRGGAPQPLLWKITLDDPRARGGIREVEVQGGRIVGERTPTGRVPGSPMNFNQLNLDSEGVFTIVNLEAQKAPVAFDRVDYLLKAGTAGGAPVWVLDLYNGSPARVARYELAADSGTILNQQIDRGGGRVAPVEEPPLAPDDRPYVERRPVEPDPGTTRPGERFRGVDDFFRRLEKRFERRGHQLENFFTGRNRSYDPERDGDYDR